MIWSDRVHTYTESSAKPGIIDDGSDVSVALMSAGGVSRGSSLMVPGLLISSFSEVQDHESNLLRRFKTTRIDSVEDTMQFAPELDTAIAEARLRSPDVTAHPATPRPPLVVPWLGIRFGEHQFAITEVVADSPAERAGLSPGDVVVAIDKKSVSSPDELLPVLFHAQIGAAVVVTFERNGALSDVTVTLGSHVANIEEM